MIVVGMNPLVTIFAAVGFAAARRINKFAEKGEDQNGSSFFIVFSVIPPFLNHNFTSPWVLVTTDFKG